MYTSNNTRNAGAEDSIRVSAVDLNKPHYPLTDDGSPWFKYTNSHFMTDLQLTPCARLLWNWVLLKAPAGTDVVVDLRDFRAITAESHRGKPYSMRQIRNAVNQLEELDLLVIKSERLRMQARHPGKVTNVANKRSNTNEKLTSTSRKLTSNSRKLISTPEKLTSTSTAETVDMEASRQSPDHTETLRSADQEMVAAAKKVFQEEKPIETKGDEVTGNGQQENPRQKEETGQPSESTHEDKCSAAQLQTLKKLGIEVSRALKEHLQETSAAIVEKAIALFQQDRATWEGPPMENPAGYFRTVLRQVLEGTREPAPGLEHRTQAVDPMVEMLNVWRKRWFSLPWMREQFRREIAAEFPNGEIVVLDDQVGPERGERS